jgi:hypothetical protein
MAVFDGVAIGCCCGLDRVVVPGWGPAIRDGGDPVRAVTVADRRRSGLDDRRRVHDADALQVPTFSTVEATVACLRCGHVVEMLAGILGFGWGATPERYRGLGELIRWYRDENGVVPSMRPIRHGARLRFNVGDPDIHRVLVFEADPHIQGITCSSCGEHYETAAVEIVGNRLQAVQLFEDGDTRRLYDRDPVDVAVVEFAADGTARVRDDLVDPAFEAI